MASNPTDTVQLAMPLGMDAIWVDMAIQEEQRPDPNVKAETQTEMVFTPLEVWWQQPSAQQNASLNDLLVEGQLYAVDGGIFKAKQQDGRWELWVWQGHNGNDVGTRNGFEVDGVGRLYDRYYGVETGESLVISPARFGINNLDTVNPSLSIYGNEAATITCQHNKRGG